MNIRTSLILVLALTVLDTPMGAAAQKTVYVATDGTLFGEGTIASPVNSIATALAKVSAGDTIYVRGGTYLSPGSIRIDDSGADGSYLHIWAYPGETPVFDFTGAPRGFDIRGHYLHIKGLVAERANDNGVYVKQASFNIIEQVIARYNGDSGVQVEDLSANNLLLNVDSYHNYDAGAHGENADGFAIKFGVGPGNVLRGCRAWGNSDDGYDFWSRDDPGQQGVTVEDSWSFANGINVWGDTDFQGDSNGFKLGHGPGAHTLIRNVAWGHLAHGFDINGNLSGVTLYNNTGYLNGGTNFYFDNDTNVEQGTSVLRNNLAFGDVRMDQPVIDAAYNSWDSETPTVTPSDFASTDTTGVSGPRAADGSLPQLEFLHLAQGSALVDAGVDVGLAFEGSEPDLGAFEVSTTVAVEAPGGVTTGLRLLPNYPNPFRATTNLSFDVTESGPVTLSVFDVRGHRVAVLLDDVLPSGSHAAVWSPMAALLPSGIYYVRVASDRNSDVRKVIYMK